MKIVLVSIWRGLLAISVSSVLATPVTWADDKDLVSDFGVYEGYAERVYNFGYQRTSQYVEAVDGTKLAVDVYRPLLENGEVETRPLPVIWHYTRYNRAGFRDGEVRPGGVRRVLTEQLPYGYVVASTQARGTGASFGSRLGPFDRPETRDAQPLLQWLGTQPWSNGNVTMQGCSYPGVNQYMAASVHSPYLKSIFPEMAWFDGYELITPGGVYAERYIKTWGNGVSMTDHSLDHVPVDADTDGSMLAEAVKEHEANRHVDEVFSALPFRDSWDEGSSSKYMERISADTYFDSIEQSGVGMYHWVGWLDGFSRDQILWWINAEYPQRLTVGPWQHCGSDDSLLETERLRWNDHYLKGVDNGVGKESVMYYYTVGAPEGTEWRHTDKWPLPTVKNVNYYFQGGKTGTVASANDGYLASKPPGKNTGGRDTKVVDYSTSSGQPREGYEPAGYYNRWSAMYNGWGGGYTDMTPNDEKAFTFTTEALMKDIEITGHPVVHLWISSTADDADFFVYLEEVDKEGYSTYLTEGILRASHRKLSKAPFKNYLGLPYHSHHEADYEALTPGEPAELVFDLLPISNVFDAGHRIRVTVANADAGNFATPVLEPAPEVTIYRDKDHKSYIELPINNRVYPQVKTATERK